MQAVWPDSFVEESNLTRNISVLRKALNRDDGGPPYIETVPKRGYRFVGEVRAIVGEQTELIVKLELDRNHDDAHAILGLAYEQLGRYQEAIAELQKK